MKHLVILMLLLFNLSLQGQDLKDHYIVTSTHDTFVSTFWQTLENSKTMLLAFRFAKHNSEYSLEFKYHFGGDNFKVEKGDSVMIKFMSGWTLTIYAKDGVESKKGLASYEGTFDGTVTPGVHVVYPITFGMLAALTTNNIEKVRIYSSRGFDNCIFPKSKRDVIAYKASVVSQRVTEWVTVKNGERQPGKEPKEQKDTSW